MDRREDEGDRLWFDPSDCRWRVVGVLDGVRVRDDCPTNLLPVPVQGASSTAPCPGRPCRPPK